MFIKELYIKNFKSIRETSIQFTPLCLIVGPNASGKSNLINVFRFIGNITTDGIDNAIAMQGGIQYLANSNLSRDHAIEIQFKLDVSDEKWIRIKKKDELALFVEELEYRFVLQPHKKGSGYRIIEDFLKITYSCYEHTASASKDDKYRDLHISYSTVFHKKTQKSSIQKFLNISGEFISDKIRASLSEDVTANIFTEWVNEDKGELMLNRISFLLPPSFNDSKFIRIFDFDPKELKKSSSMVSTRVLSENGSNLASVLQNILRTKAGRQKLTILLKQFLPFVDGISVENNLDKSYSYKIRESFSKKYFHANFLSDGTVSVIALIIALYFEEQANIIILEEPERNIHPKLLSNLLSAADDVSSEKQIIITTHNPEILKHAKLKNIRLVSRDSHGFTSVTTPEKSQKVLSFIENDLGIDDLFLQNLLGE